MLAVSQDTLVLSDENAAAALERRINVARAEFSLGKWRLVVVVRQAYKRLPPPDPDPRPVVAKTDPTIAQLLLDVNGKPTTFANLVMTVINLKGLPHNVASWTEAARVLTAGTTTTVATTGSTAVTGDRVTFTMNPDLRPLLEEKAKEKK